LEGITSFLTDSLPCRERQKRDPQKERKRNQNYTDNSTSGSWKMVKYMSDAHWG
jgi:hypothetical protein